MTENLLKTGDLIGVAGVESDWGAAIMASSKKQVFSIYDHIGMIENGSEGILVWNANPHEGVIAEPLEDFIRREEVKIEKNFDIFRLERAIDFGEVLARMRLLQGLPYNFSFIQSEEAYYCSDFIARTFPQNFFPLEPMHFEGDFWLEYYQKQGLEVPEGLPGINPNDIFAQENLIFLGNLKELR